jgi:hypothetical protein
VISVCVYLLFARVRFDVLQFVIAKWVKMRRNEEQKKKKEMWFFGNCGIVLGINAEAISKGQPVGGRESEIVFSWICLLIKEQLDKTIVKFR